MRLAAKPGEPGTARRTSRWAEPCPGSGSLPVSSPCRLNDENSRGKVQNVRGDSTAVSLSEDGGATRRWTRHLERSVVAGQGAPEPPQRGEYHDPSIIQARDGTLHATYSYFIPPAESSKDEQGRLVRKAIKHAHFNEAWIRAGTRFLVKRPVVLEAKLRGVSRSTSPRGADTKSKSVVRADHSICAAALRNWPRNCCATLSNVFTGPAAVHSTRYETTAGRGGSPPPTVAFSRSKKSFMWRLRTSIVARPLVRSTATWSSRAMLVQNKPFCVIPGLKSCTCGGGSPKLGS